MRLRELFINEVEEPGISNSTLRSRTPQGYLQTSSDWAGELFGGVNQRLNKPEELATPDDNNASSTDTDTDTATGEPSPGSANDAGVSADSDLITMIKGFEGYHEKTDPGAGTNSSVRPYWDVAQWSIGYGSYAGSRNRNSRPNITWTPQQAEQALRSQLVPYRRGVERINRQGGYAWSPAQLDALTSFAYNIGSINQLTNNSTRSNREIADKMLEYVNAGGQRLPGLVNRRRIERQKFLNGMAQSRLNYRPGTATS